MNDIWFGVFSDFSDLHSSAEILRFAVRLLMSAILGGLIGFERQHSHKPAGLRTHMLVSLGATVFILASQPPGEDVQAMSRVIQGLATGIGFLGGGAILKDYDQRNIYGLTTAAGIWMTAAVGAMAGAGRLATATLAALLALSVLTVARRLESSRH